MVKRLLVLLITVGVLVGTAGVAAAWRHDFESRGSRDYPPRVAVFPLFAVGVLIDTLVFKPISYMACAVPDFTGCSPEERRALGMEEMRETQELPGEGTGR